MKRLVFMSFFLMTGFVHVQAQHEHHARSDQALKAGEIHPEHSLYHLDVEFINHHEDQIELSSLKGKPVIVVMFYGNCTEVCPILIRDSWRLYNSVSESLQKNVQVLAVSFDTENDSPAVLKEYADYEQLNIPGWHFVTGKDSDIRSLAMMMGVKYQKKSDGHFAHSNLVTVLDEKGNIAKRVEGLNQPMEDAAATIEEILYRIHHH